MEENLVSENALSREDRFEKMRRLKSIVKSYTLLFGGHLYVVDKKTQKVMRSISRKTSNANSTEMEPVATNENARLNNTSVYKITADKLLILLQEIQQGTISQKVIEEHIREAIHVLLDLKEEEENYKMNECGTDVMMDMSVSDEISVEVKRWIESTFLRQPLSQQSQETATFRSAANAIRAGIFVDKMYRKRLIGEYADPCVFSADLLEEIDNWEFDIFNLSSHVKKAPLTFLTCELFTRYNLVSKFQIPMRTLESFMRVIENGYSKNGNAYHNNVHASDVLQTIHCVLMHTHLTNVISELEVFAVLLAAIIHDFDHTGTTNSYHVSSDSELALLYNDRSVLENHHISAVFRIDKFRFFGFFLHFCDISHPMKPWNLHEKWTMLLMEEFFRQGDEEEKLGLPISPLCDRKSTHVAESQIGSHSASSQRQFHIFSGFINFILEPSLEICELILERMLKDHRNLLSRSLDKHSSTEDEKQPTALELQEGEAKCSALIATWHDNLRGNRKKWEERLQRKENP